MDANLAFTGTVVAIDVTSMVFNSAKVNDLLPRNVISSTQTRMHVPVFDLVLDLAFAWVLDANNGYTVRSRCARAVSDLDFNRIRMKIIDNKKDYYDYLASIYGIDELVVYDRRGSVSLNSEKYLLHGIEYYFSHKLLPLDKPLSEKKYWSLKSISKQREAKAVKHKFNKTFKEGDVYHFVLEVGYTHYRFEVERWKDEKTPNLAHVETTLLDTIKDVRQRYSKVPMCIIPCQAEYWRWHHEEKWEEIKSSLTHRVENPILADTFIPKMISPTDIWHSLYEYLSSLRDKPFTDTRSDVQKLESAGFDKKTSFRNIK